MTNCLFFGDSITYGEYDGILGGWVDHLKRYCHLKYYNENANEVNVFNLGIGGETTDGLRLRFEIETKARLSPDENLIFFLYGANDLAIKNNQEIVALVKFHQNLHNVVTIAKKYTTNIFLISILPISKTIDGSIVASGKLRTNNRIVLYNTKLQEIAHEESINYVDIHTDFCKKTETLISKDGVHPNEEGYAFISTIIKPLLEKYL